MAAFFIQTSGMIVGDTAIPLAMVGIGAMLGNLIEGQMAFRLTDGTLVYGSVFIGETEFLPVEVLRSDPDAYQAEFNAWLGDVWVPEQKERRNQLLILYGNARRYVDLRQAIARRQVVPLVGSGMSASSGLPTWCELLRRIHKFTKIDEAQLDRLLDASAFEEAAELLALGTNSNLLNERVKHDLRVDDFEIINGPVRLLPVLFPDLVITTNLDDLLEQHYRRCDREFTHVLAGSELARYRQIRGPTERFLLKLHGDCRRASSRVLLKAEYEAAYAPGRLIREELTLLYRTHCLLFLGCSLGPDRTVQLVAEVASGDKNMPKHYAVLAVPDSDEKRIDRENFLTERGIYPISYDGTHDEAIMALLAGLLEDVGVV
jgi:hypothetical protein